LGLSPTASVRNDNAVRVGNPAEMKGEYFTKAFCSLFASLVFVVVGSYWQAGFSLSWIDVFYWIQGR